MTQKKHAQSVETLADKETQAILEAQELIDGRKPKSDYDSFVFQLNTGKQHFLKPKCEFIASNGFKLKIRYHKEFNSIFEAEQEFDIDEGVELSRIGMPSTMVIKDEVLLEYLLIYHEFGKKYKLLDPVGTAEAELENFNKVNDVWVKISAMPNEKLQALMLLVTSDSFDSITRSGRAPMLLTLRNKVEADPEAMADALVDPMMDTIFLYYAAMKLKEIRRNKNSGAIVWGDTGKEICQVPPNVKEPSKHFAKLMLTDDYSKTRDLLESKING